MKRLFALTFAFLLIVGILWLQDMNDSTFRIPDIISEYSEKPQKNNSNSKDMTASAWVSTVFNIDYPSNPTTDSQAMKSECKDILDKAKKAGLSTIYLQVRPSADAFYKSELFPWSTYLTGSQGTAPSDSFDPLAYWVKQAHKRNIRLEAWINPYRICSGTNAKSNFEHLSDSSPARQHPEWVVECDGGYYFDPGIPEAREYIVNGVSEIVKSYDVDGIQFDDYFYPSQDFDDSATYSAYGGDFNSLADWRRNNVNLLVEQVYNTVHSDSKNKHCVFGISPSGIWKNGYGGIDGSETSGYEHYNECYADSVKWIKNGWVDYICPQIYWEIGNSAADFKTLVNWWSDTVKNTDVQLRIGIAAYKCGEPDSGDIWYKHGKAQLKKQIALCRKKKNISDISLFTWHDIDDKNYIFKILRKEF